MLPARVDLRGAGDVLGTIQAYLSEVVSIEHVSLSKIQRWIRPGAGLFEVLFSISVKDRNRVTIWDVIESKNPEQDVRIRLSLEGSIC